MLEGPRPTAISITAPVGMRGGDSQSSGDLVEVGDLAKDAKSGAEMEVIRFLFRLDALGRHWSALIDAKKFRRSTPWPSRSTRTTPRAGRQNGAGDGQGVSPTRGRLHVRDTPSYSYSA